MDLDFNVNVHTDSNGYIMGGSGGHSDTAAGSKLAIIVAPLIRARLPLIVDQVLCKSTPGETVDVIVTQRGIAVNPRQNDLKEKTDKSRTSCPRYPGTEKHGRGDCRCSPFCENGRESRGKSPLPWTALCWIRSIM